MEEDSKEGAEPCRAGKKHRFYAQECWAAVVVTTAFDIRSEKTALQFFSEACWEPEDYQVARKLSAKEIAELRSGSARLAITLVRPHAI